MNLSVRVLLASIALAGCTPSTEQPQFDPADYVGSETFSALSARVDRLTEQLEKANALIEAQELSDTQTVDGLRQEVATVKTKFGDIETRIGTQDEHLAQLSASVDDNKSLILEVKQEKKRAARVQVGPDFHFRASSINQIGARHYIAVARAGSRRYELRGEGQSIGDGWRVETIDVEKRTAVFTHHSGKSITRII